MKMIALSLLQQVLEQVSPKISEVICKSASEHPERNRSNQYLPCECSELIMEIGPPEGDPLPNMCTFDGWHLERGHM